jgi:V/A-type H+-transporting ATPase subunit E
MKELETGKDKIKKICDILKNETLDPAKKEAEKIIQAAEEQARAIIKKAEIEANEMVKNAQKNNAAEKVLLEKQIAQALSQAKEKLRQEVQESLFNENLVAWLDKESADPTLVANIINALVQAVEKEGLSADLSAVVGKTVSIEKINATLLKDVLAKLRGQTVSVGDFVGGAQLQLHDKRLTLDMSDRALKELLGSLMRKEFRDILFQHS